MLAKRLVEVAFVVVLFIDVSEVIVPEAILPETILAVVAVRLVKESAVKFALVAKRFVEVALVLDAFVVKKVVVVAFVAVSAARAVVPVTESVPATVRRDPGALVPIPTFPFWSMVKSAVPVDEEILNGLIPLVPCTLNVKSDEVALMPSTVPLSKKPDGTTVVGELNRATVPSTPPVTPVVVVATTLQLSAPGAQDGLSVSPCAYGLPGGVAKAVDESERKLERETKHTTQMKNIRIHTCVAKHLEAKTFFSV